MEQFHLLDQHPIHYTICWNESKQFKQIVLQIYAGKLLVTLECLLIEKFTTIFPSSRSILEPFMTCQVDFEGRLVLENPAWTFSALDFFRFRVLHQLVNVQCLFILEIFSTGNAREWFGASMDLSMLL